MPSSCSRGFVGVGGQFCSRKEKQISGTRGLVLLRPLQGRVGASVGEGGLEMSVATGAMLSSALSSAWKEKKKNLGDLYFTCRKTTTNHNELNINATHLISLEGLYWCNR